MRVVEAEPEGGEQLESEAEAPVEPVSEAQLRREITDSNRDLETVREINRDLVELKDALELKIEALRLALEARNRTIDRLEQRLNETLQKPAGKERQTRATRELLGGEQRVPGGVRSDIEMGRGKTEQPATKPESTEVGKQPQSLQEKGLDLARKYWLELAVAGGLLLLLFIVVLVRKRKADSRVPDADSFGSYIEDDDQPVTQASPLVTDESKSEVHQPLAATKEPEENEEGFVPGETTDVASALTEADIYLAYRRYGQAESLIQQAIESNPENMILKAKLLEIYAFRKDKSRFAAMMEEAYPAMTARSPEIWAKIVDMAREIVPDHELVVGGTLPGNSNDDLDNAFSLDLNVARGKHGELPPGGGDRER